MAADRGHDKRAFRVRSTAEPSAVRAGAVARVLGRLQLVVKRLDDSFREFAAELRSRAQRIERAVVQLHQLMAQQRSQTAELMSVVEQLQLSVVRLEAKSARSRLGSCSSMSSESPSSESTSSTRSRLSRQMSELLHDLSDVDV